MNNQNKKENPFKWAWSRKSVRAWMITFAVVQIVFFIITMVVFNIEVRDPATGARVPLSNTLDIVLGGPRSVVRSGDPRPYQRYMPINDWADPSGSRGERHGFRQFEPSQDITEKRHAYQEGNRLNQEIVEEGIVLLTNASRQGQPVLPFNMQRNRVSVFGKNSVNIVVGGSGSSGGGDGGGPVLLDGLTEAGFEINPVLRSFYQSSRSGPGRPRNPAMGTIPAGIPTGETPISSYTTTVTNSYANFEHAAIVVITRISGEGFDLPRTMATNHALTTPVAGAASVHDHFLRLDQNERDLLQKVTAMRDDPSQPFDKVIVLLNLSMAMEVGFLQAQPGDDDYFGHIDAALWIGSPGFRGAYAVGRILNGEVNPSGRLFATFSRDFLRNPSLQNFANNSIAYNPTTGNFSHTGIADAHRYLNAAGGNTPFFFVEYQEGIYVGYRYYESRGFMEIAMPLGNNNWHSENVVFPFGFGESFTTFDWEIVGVRQDEDVIALNKTVPTEIRQPIVHANGVNDARIEIDVRVTNTGTRAGRDVVQLYFNPQFNFGGIEKPHVALGAFEKTGLIAPGANQVVTLSINAFDMASYDWQGVSTNALGQQLLPNGGYVLERDNFNSAPGMYRLFIGRDAHSAWHNVFATHGPATPVISTTNDLVVTFQVTDPIIYTRDPVTGNEIRNRFSEPIPLNAPNSVIENLDQYSISHFILHQSNMVRGRQGQGYLSRSDFVGTWPVAPTNLQRRMPGGFINTLTNNSLSWEINDTPEDRWWRDPSEMPTHGEWQADGARLYHLIRPLADASRQANGRYCFNHLRDEVGAISVSWDDPIFQDILDQMSLEDMTRLIGRGAFSTIQLAHIGKPRTTDPDGPSGFVSFMGDPSVHGTVFYASGPTIAATWNVRLAFDFGVMVGIEGLFGDTGRWGGDGRPYSGWYAPGMNIHRTPFSGRNSEYYSECPFLSGMIGAHTVLGARSKGVYTFIKHFAVNDQETDRSNNGLVTWLDEQTMREIYLRPFEMAVKIGGATAMMSAFNRIGMIWAGGSYVLLNEVLRYEWGFRGTVITDYNLYPFMPVNQMIRAGGDLNLVQGGTANEPSRATAHQQSATHVQAMRTASHNILYTVVQSSAMNGWSDTVTWGERMPLWQELTIVFNFVLLGIFLIWGFLVIFFKIRKERKLTKEGGEFAETNNEAITHSDSSDEV